MKHSGYFLKQAWLSLKLKPGFIISVVSTMGITMGALLAIMTLAYFMVIKPLPYPDQDKLAKIEYQRFDENSVLKSDTYLHPAAVSLYKTQQTLRALDELSLLFYAQETIASLPMQPKLNTTYTTPEWYSLLNVPLAFGTAFSADEGLNSHIPGAVISYQTWQKFFGSSPDVLEQSIRINGQNHPIKGVISEDFIEPQLFKTGRLTQIWLPWDYNNSEYQGYWGLPDNNVLVVGKLKENTSASQSSQLLHTAVNEIFSNEMVGQGSYQNWSISLAIKPLKSVLMADSIYTVILLFSGALGLVLIAATNISNLFLARTVAQHRQLSIAAALGAKKSQIRFLLLCESGILMALSTCLALVVSLAGFIMMQTYFSQYLPRVQELQLDMFTMGSAVIIAVVLAYFFAWLSSRMINYRSLNTTLQSSGKGTGIQVSKKVRNRMIGCQISIATALVFANGLIIQDALEQLDQDPGFSTEQLISMEFSVATLDWKGWNAYVPKVRELQKNMLLQPAVSGMSFSRSPIADLHQFPVTDVESNQEYFPFHRNIDNYYLDVTEQSLLIGEGFTEQHVRDQSNVAIVNQTFARMLAVDTQSALGKTLSINGGKPNTIIGVVRDLHLPSKKQVPPRFYVTNYGTGLWMLIKLKPHQKFTREHMIKVLADTDSQFVLSKFEQVNDSIYQENFPKLLTAVAAGVLAMLTIALAGLGLLGIISYSTQVRRLELSTRMAIGAKRKDILKMMFSENLRVVLAGILAGIALSSLVFFIFQDELFAYLTWFAVPILICTALLVISMSLIASFMPLRNYFNQPIIHGLRGID